MEKRLATDEDRPNDILKLIQPAKFNYGTVPAGSSIDFKFRLMGDAPLAIAFAPGCGCQGEMHLTEPDESGVQVLTGTMKTKDSERMAKDKIVENYEQYVDIFFNNPPYFEFKEDGSKEARIGNNLKSVRLFVNGSIEKES